MDKTALILNQTSKEISFQVEDLEICENPLPLQTAKTQLEERVYTPLAAAWLRSIEEIINNWRL